MPDAVDTPFLFLPRHPNQLAGFMQVHEGKVCAIVENYAEVFVEPPVLTDGTSHVWAIEVDPSDVKVFQDGDRTKLMLWRGDKGSRTKPQDKLTLPIYTMEVAQSMLIALQGAGAAAPVAADPVEAAKAAFAEIPAEVQLAAVIGAVPVSVLEGLPEMTPARASAVSNWATATVAAYMTAQAPAAAAAGAGA